LIEIVIISLFGFPFGQQFEEISNCDKICFFNQRAQWVTDTRTSVNRRFKDSYGSVRVCHGLGRALALTFAFHELRELRIFSLRRRTSAESCFSRFRKLGRSQTGPFPRRSALIALRTPRNSDSIGIVVLRMSISPSR
jgi:hypothetical protein